MLKTILEMFWSFCQIGYTSFGGMSMIPLINDEMVNHGWMTSAEVADVVAIAEMTPGPNGLNIATFAGLRTAGILGALACNLGMLMPTFTLCALAAVFFEKFKKSPLLASMMVGVRPASLGILAAVIITLAQSSYVIGGAVSYSAIAIGLISLLLLLKWKWSVPKVIALAALLGLILPAA